jgi:hypothetical protein
MDCVQTIVPQKRRVALIHVDCGRGKSALHGGADQQGHEFAKVL